MMFHALREKLAHTLAEADELNSEMMTNELQRIILDQVEKEEDGEELPAEQAQARAVVRQAVGDNTQLIERVVEKLRLAALKAEELRDKLSEHQEFLSTEFLSSKWQVRDGEEPVVFGDDGIPV